MYRFLSYKGFPWIRDRIYTCIYDPCLDERQLIPRTARPRQLPLQELAPDLEDKSPNIPRQLAQNSNTTLLKFMKTVTHRVSFLKDISQCY